MAENLYQRPVLSGQMVVSSDYNVLNSGFTDRIFLLGHADGIELNDPYPVVDVQAAINILGGDMTCPLLKSMLELYYSGARDIWLMAVAPMSEYVELSNRTHDFYVNYANRLQVAYDLLLAWDYPHIMVPLNAPFVDAMGVDFLTPLAQTCSDSFESSGLVRLGLIGTQTGPIHGYVDTMVNDPRLVSIGDIGKYVMVVIGEGSVNTKELPVVYTCPSVTAVAAELSQLPWNRSIAYHRLRNISALTTPMTEAELTALSNAKLNPVSNTTLGDRNEPFNVVIQTDNTLGTTGTDFWSIFQMRFVQHLIEVIQTLGRGSLGTIGYGEYKRQVQAFLFNLQTTNYIRQYTLNISRNPYDQLQVLVDVSVKLYFGVRQIQFTTMVGPGQ